MPNEYAEWKALEARVSEAEAGAGPPLTPAEEARWGELMDGWEMALEQAATAAWLVQQLPGAMLPLLDGVERICRDVGATVPLWVGLARERVG